MVSKINSTVILFLLAVCLTPLSSCDEFPKDTYGTFQKIRDDTLFVGYAENPPWAIDSEGELTGIEVVLVKGFAKSINADIKWVNKNEQSLLKELEHRNLHLVVSGLTQKTPWKGKVSLTGSYLSHKGQKHVLAVPSGEHRLLFELEEYLNMEKEKGKITELLNQYTAYK